ncbi:TPA: glycoside hydrolase family 125 protein [Listeria monocytogenes]|uniref:glycoside hydrolase family 125 protein n=1 Tax=Listeria monocytogenes TaxID=1639 RepID=UPI000874B276|nr:glycoside hydrolase family 125 protein [Listeria monocytogenes]ECH7281341.1 glycoside hydrolase family 125 protein [Listeria monocytogenes]ECQ6575663.1 glycoside hydrolase family 125 protein [Listeria monocytogenes]EKZ1002926.1 glycoside hydrolase family 125 protein [Listeria monocytogenes]EKZ1008591.1 glycoside hydrolase family 125 protein [Listeria monocytogenes]OFG65176.1 metal-independent alpha-mannosidase [Listeria monocytogenes]
MVIANRAFIQTSTEKIKKEINNQKLVEMYKRCMENTLDTTIKIRDSGLTFILTGDIPAMWLRDSVCQVRPFLLFAKENEEIESMLIGLSKEQVSLVEIDPYANAFNETPNGAGHQADKTERHPQVWERKYEIDSLCYPIQLAYLIWKITGRTEQFDAAFFKMLQTIFALWEVEQHHETKSPYRFERLDCVPSDTLKRDGLGTETAYTGMLWSGFRPSDDACEYGYLIPSNMFAVVVLGYAKEIIEAFYPSEIETIKQAATLQNDIQLGIEKFGTYNHPTFGEIFAFEVDGLGNQLLMDDANVPSLLSMPIIQYLEKESPIYQNTRKFILSKSNPFYFEGKLAKGIGSPHTPAGYIWPIGLAIQGLTASDKSEKLEILQMLLRTDAGTGLMHESFHPDYPEDFTREWFSWANMMFCELVLDVAGFRMANVLKN